MTSMKAAQISAFTEDFATVRLQDVPRPTVRAGFALVKVAAAAVNPVDWKVIGGFLKDAWPCPLPMLPGYDFSGTVVELGEGVDGFAVGDEVFAVNWGEGNHGAATDEEPVCGAFAQYIALPAAKLSRKPAELSHQQAAAVALVGTTAMQSLRAASVGAGKTVVVLGGSGAVGLLAVQIAKQQGATVITTCSPRTRAFVDTLGADRIIDYTAGPWFEDAELAAAEVDAVIDTVGQEGSFAAAKRVLKEDGAFVTIASFEAGVEPGAHPPLSFASFLCLTNEPAVQDELAGMLAAGKLKLPIEDAFPFTQEGITALLDKQKGGKSVGKNVLLVS